MAGASEPGTVSTKRQRIAELAKQAPTMGFTSLAHHIDLTWLHEAYVRTRPDGAVGVDGQSIGDFNAHLGDNLRRLLEQAKSSTYRAPPVRRVHIPKGTGTETRPIGIPTFADKVLQRAVVMALEPIYEQDFLDCSYGFRPGRSAHQALEALWQQAMALGGCWLVEVDLRKFFDTLVHSHLRGFLRQRLRDGVLLRLIDKWLRAGVLEDGVLTHPEAGSPQGGVISPLLSNVYLHYVLDVWFEREVKPRLRGQAFLVRYADDFVMGFACEEDARRVLEVLPKRFGKHGLAIHPDKTRLVPFRRPAARGLATSVGYAPKDTEGQAPESFDFLGFTHFWSRSKRGFWVIKRKTASSRFRRALKTIALWCRRHRHVPIRQQHETLCQKLRGHYAYYGGVIGNLPSLKLFRYEVVRRWRLWLIRRRRRGRLAWDGFNGMLKRFVLPWPRARASPSAANP
jgi:RNA-directed DNA polymerase